MNKEILYEILNSKSETLSSTEIENIMNEELDKSAQDMDTDLIDLCLEALNTVDEEKLNKRKKKYRFGRVFIAAAIFVLIIGITIPLCAKYLSINVPEGIVSLYKECFNIDITYDKCVDDIYGQLEKDGIDDVVLPELLFESTTEISNYSLSVGDNATLYAFDFKKDNIFGRVSIEKYNQYDFFSGKIKISSEFDNVSYIEKDQIQILVFSKNDLSYIKYTDDKTDYSIVLETDYSTAYQIAKVI